MACQAALIRLEFWKIDEDFRIQSISFQELQ